VTPQRRLLPHLFRSRSVPFEDRLSPTGRSAKLGENWTCRESGYPRPDGATGPRLIGIYQRIVETDKRLLKWLTTSGPDMCRFSAAGMKVYPRAGAAGGRKAPRHEIAGRETCSGRLYAKLDVHRLKFEKSPGAGNGPGLF